MLDRYVAQVRLLLSVLPDIARETVFALKGGTAINLFYRDMPRLSVDIDLTYLPVADRQSSLKEIDDAFNRIATAIAERNPRVRARRIAAVVLVGETDAGWLVDAASAEEAIDIVHGTFPRAREVWRSEPLVRTEDCYRHPYFLESSVPRTTADCLPCVAHEAQPTWG